MNRKFLFIGMVAIAAMTSCTGVELNVQDNSQGTGRGDGWGEGEIVLATPRLGSAADTKAPYEGAIGVGNPLLARVAATLTQGDYSNLHVDGLMNFTSSSTLTGFEPTPTGDKYYPGSNDIYIFGLYPVEGENSRNTWAQDAGRRSWEFTFDGSDDVMVAPEVAANKDNAAPRLTFQHLLTRLNIYLKAASYDVVDRWGTINSITLTKVKNANPSTKVSVSNLRNTPTVQFDLKDVNGLKCYEAIGNGSSNNITYSDVVYANEGYRLTDESELQAYTLMEAITLAEGDRLMLKITMDGATVPDGAEREVEVALMDHGNNPYTGNTAGVSFNIRLTFDAAEIVASAQVMDWVDGGDGDVVIN